MILQPASLKRRLAALVYESFMVVAVAIVAGIFAGIINTLIVRTVPILLNMMPLLTTFLFLFCWWFYFKINWLREGQTLPMRVWGILLTDEQGMRPNVRRLRIRFIWATIFLVFIPFLAYYLLRQVLDFDAKVASSLAVLWWILPWGFALFQPQRQFLYDYLAGTQLIDQRVTR